MAEAVHIGFNVFFILMIYLCVRSVVRSVRAYLTSNWDR